MERAAPRFTPCSRNSYIISVTSYEDQTVAGVLYSPVLDCSFAFRNLIQMLLRMEDLMDRVNLPQRGMERRTFQEGPPGDPLKGLCPGVKGPVLATFKVSIFFRQNASWQGNMIWSEKKVEANFRSVLELVGLMDSALRPRSESGPTEF